MATRPLAIVGADTVQGNWYEAKLCDVDISEFVLRPAIQFSKKVLCHYDLGRTSDLLSGTFIFIGRRGAVRGIIEVDQGYITRVQDGYHAITCSFDEMLKTRLPILRTIEYGDTKDLSTRQEGFIVFDKNSAPRQMTSAVSYRRIRDWFIENNTQCP